MKKSTLTKTTAATAGIVLASTMSIYAINKALYQSILYRTPPKRKLHKNDADYTEINKRIDDVIHHWLPTIKKKDVYIHSFDSLTLHAEEIEIPDIHSHTWVIQIHGYRGSSQEMYVSSRVFYHQGYNCFIVDNRGHGKSEGNYIGMGWHDRLDILKWIDYIIQKDPQAKIILYGVSMGGATTMMVTGEPLPKNVICAIEDCGYTSIEDILSSQLKAVFHITSKIPLKTFNLLCKKKAHYSIYEGNAIKQLEKSKTPTLFIHGDQDHFVPFSMLKQCYDACSAPKQMWIAKGASHATASLDEHYFPTVLSFIKQYL